MSGSFKKGQTESRNRPTLSAFNAMKLVTSIIVLMMFVQAAGAPHAKSDPRYERKIPAITETAHAEALPKPQTKPVSTPPATTVAFDPNNPATYPTCAADQVVWAQDGQCHQKPVASPVASAPTTASPVVTSLSAPIYDCSNEDSLHGMQYIFCHESGSIPNRPNAEGCVGLGQACPASKLYSVCPTLDVDCQIGFFANYAASRYGGWGGAESFWRSNRWW